MEKNQPPVCSVSIPSNPHQLVLDGQKHTELAKCPKFKLSTQLVELEVEISGNQLLWASNVGSVENVHIGTSFVRGEPNRSERTTIKICRPDPRDLICKEIFVECRSGVCTDHMSFLRNSKSKEIIQEHQITLELEYDENPVWFLCMNGRFC
jgi:hypothetical protein